MRFDDTKSTEVYLHELAEHLLAAVEMALLVAACVVLVGVVSVWGVTGVFHGFAMLAAVALAGAFAVVDNYRESIPIVPSLDGVHADDL